MRAVDDDGALFALVALAVMDAVNDCTLLKFSQLSYIETMNNKQEKS